MSADTKKCLYCGEEIKKEALKCWHCKEILDSDLKRIREDEIESPKQEEQKKYLGKILLAVALVIILIKSISSNASNGAIALLILLIILSLFGALRWSFFGKAIKYSFYAVCILIGFILAALIPGLGIFVFSILIVAALFKYLDW